MDFRNKADMYGFQDDRWILIIELTYLVSDKWLELSVQCVYKVMKTIHIRHHYSNYSIMCTPYTWCLKMDFRPKPNI